MSKPTPAVIGIDVGGTKIAAGMVLLPEGRLVHRRRIPTAPQRGGQTVFLDVLHLVDELVAEARFEGRSIQGIGLGICELVSREGRLLSSACLDWTKIPVLERLSTIAPAVMEADVRAAALGEARMGAGKPYRQFIYITVGTGIACSWVLDGVPFLGARGATGTMASTPLGVVCERCGHVHRQTLEQIASGPALVERFNRQSQPHLDSAAAVLAAAGRDEAALEIIQSAAEALGAHVGMLVNVLDPEAVVVGGGLGSVTGMYWDYFLESARRHIWSDVHRGLPILQAGLGADAGLIGAALAADRHAAQVRASAPKADIAED